MVLKNSARSAYRSARSSIATARDVEAALLSEVTSELRHVVDQRGSHAQLCSALQRNTLIWQALKSDLNGANNALPQSLKEQLLSLADFVFIETDQVLRGSPALMS